MINYWVKNLHKRGLNGNQMVIRLVWSISMINYKNASSDGPSFVWLGVLSCEPNQNQIFDQKCYCQCNMSPETPVSWRLVFYPLTIWVTCFQIQKVENIPFEHFIASPYTPTVTEKKVQVNPCCPPRFLSTQHTTIAKMSRKTRYITWWGWKKLWKMWLWYVLCSTSLIIGH